MKNFFKLLLGTSLCLLEQSDRSKNLRHRAVGKIGDLRDAVQQRYEDAADRVAKASRAIRGQDNQSLGNALCLAAGVGVGLAVVVAVKFGRIIARSYADAADTESHLGWVE